MSPGVIDDTAGSLGEAINAATKTVHTKLNKLIIYRLPLAMPPHVDEPSNYTTGLVHIAPIYSTFETLWKDILNSPPLPSEGDNSPDSHSCGACKPSAAIHHTRGVLDAPHEPTVCTRIHSLLAHLHMPELERTAALKEDIRALTGWSPSLLEEQLASATESPVLARFIQHIRQSVQDRPHTLLAYAWVLYMALFSGGRFIRASMARIDILFWVANALSSNPDHVPDVLPVHFFTFDEDRGGDQIKPAFKKRLLEAENLLTNTERDEIVAEAINIFDFMVELVGELDTVCETDTRDKVVDTEESIMARMGRMLGLRTRDSLVVAKERRACVKTGDE